MSQAVTVVKVGGNVIDHEADLNEFLSQFSKIPGPKVLVHGGGKLATELSERLGIPQKLVDGRRVTDAATLQVVTQVYGGWINKNLVAKLQALGCLSIGVSGIDGDLVLAEKRPLKNGIDYGFVGDVKSVRASFLLDCFKQGLTPVVAPLTHDGKGQILNTNADTLANEIAVALGACGCKVTLVFTFEKPGVLLDVQNEASVLPTLNAAQFEALQAQGKVFSGMIPKLTNACQSVARGLEQVILGRATDLERLLAGTTGTRVIR
jgi:acetylglutamate kinase